MTKLISELSVGDKVFVIHKNNWILDVAEVIEFFDFFITIQFCICDGVQYVWRIYDKNMVESRYNIIFTNEDDALSEFKKRLWQQ